jgi:hypothetical protein
MVGEHLDRPDRNVRPSHPIRQYARKQAKKAVVQKTRKRIKANNVVWSFNISKPNSCLPMIFKGTFWIRNWSILSKKRGERSLKAGSRKLEITALQKFQQVRPAEMFSGGSAKNYSVSFFQ